MRLSDKPYLAIVGLVLISVVGGAIASRLLAPEARTPAPAALVASADRAKGAATADSGRLVAARAVTDGTTAAVRQTLTLYDTVRKPLILFPRTAEDTARALTQFPRFALTADRLAQACAADTLAHAKERTTAQQLDSSRLRTIAALDSLVDALRTPKRFASSLEIRYEPVARVAGIAASAELRVVGDWRAGARGEYWNAAGERGRLYVYGAHPIF